MTDDTTYLVRLPKALPLYSLVRFAANQGYMVRWVIPRDMRSRSLYEVVDRGEPAGIQAEPDRGEPI